jgi:hypothetical protein
MVDSAMNSRSAIRRFEQPSARSPGTSRSALRQGDRRALAAARPDEHLADAVEQPHLVAVGVVGDSGHRAIGADRPACGHDGVVDDRLAIIVQREMSSCFRHI